MRTAASICSTVLLSVCFFANEYAYGAEGESKSKPAATEAKTGPKDQAPLTDPQDEKSEQAEDKVRDEDLAPIEARDVVVTATRTVAKRETSGVSTTVIGGDETALHQDPLLAESLRMVPGLTPSQSGPKGGITTLFTRGGESDHTLVLYDGFKINPQGGQFNFSTLSPTNLERLEIARGPGSSLFGSDAVTGAVNLVTRKGEGPPKLTTSAAGGTYGTDRETLGLEGNHKRFSYLVSSERLHRSSFQPNNSELDTYNYAGRFDYQIDDDHDVKMIVRGSDINRGWFESTGSGYGTAVEPADPNDQIHNNDWLLGFEYNGHLHEIWDTTWRLGYWGADNRLESRAPNPPSSIFGFGTLPGRTLALERRPSVDWQNKLLAWDGPNIRNTVIAGVQFENEQFDQDDTQFGAFIETDRSTIAGFAQNRLELYNRAFVNLGLRREQNTQFGSFTTARADVSILVPESHSRLHGSVGNAFRAPSFYELYAPHFGNGDLTPEANFAFDVGWEQKFWKDRIVLDATYFENRFSDLVNFDFAASTFENLNTARTSGWELQAEARPIKRLIVRGTATYLHTQDDAGKRLLRRPPHTYTAQLIAKPIAGLDISLELLSVGNRIDIAPGGRVHQAGYIRADAAVSYAFLEHFRAFARWENFTDTDYEDVATFPAEGSNVLGGLEFTWRF